MKGTTMHEMSITTSLVELLNEHLKRYPGAKVTRVNLKVGKLTAVEPDALTFCFQVLTEGTSIEGAQLQIELVPIRARCLQCQNCFEVEGFYFQCPRCSGTELETIAGNELDLMSLEIEEDEKNKG